MDIYQFGIGILDVRLKYSIESCLINNILFISHGSIIWYLLIHYDDTVAKITS